MPKEKCQVHRALESSRADDILSEAGLSRTELRLSLIAIFSKWKKPHSQKDLLDALRRSGTAGVDRVSVYRNLHQFIEAGLIHEVATNSYVSCQHLSPEDDSHVVLFCQKCEKHEEVCEESDRSFLDRLLGKSSFFGSASPLLISGVCRGCSGL